MGKALQGKTVVFTGTLDMQRSKATAMATDAGAKVTSAISGNTDIVVAGAQAGSKLDQAKAKGITIMKESEFVAACSSKPSSAGGGKTVTAPKKKTPSALSPASDASPSSPSSIPKFWEWYDAENSSWIQFADSDSKLLEANFMGSNFSFKATSELSFNKKYKTPYFFDLLKKTQKNTESGAVKKIRRFVNGVESYQRGGKPEAGATSRGKRGHDDDEKEAENEEEEEESVKPTGKIPPKKKSPVIKKKEVQESQPLEGKTLVFTGTLSMKRTVATAKATSAGAKVTGSVSKKTDFLVCGEDAGSKEEQAESLGVKIISEKKFLQMCDGQQSGGSDSDDDEEEDGEEDEGFPLPLMETPADLTSPAVFEELEAFYGSDKFITGDSESVAGDTFPRRYYLSQLYYLRAGKYEEEELEDDDEQVQKSIQSEIKYSQSGKNQGRLMALKNGMQVSKSIFDTMVKDEDGDKWDVLEENFLFFGYPQCTKFTFSIPPRANKGFAAPVTGFGRRWGINEVLRASHYHEDKKDFEDWVPNKDKEKLSVLSTGEDLEDHQEGGMSDLFKALTKVANDCAEDGEEAHAKSVQQIEDWKKRLESLPFYKNLRWAEGEGGNCDQTVFFIYLVDRINGVVSGIFQHRQY